MNSTQKARKGIILAGGEGTRLQPVTVAMSKQLLPVYDKPMIFYPLSVLMLAGIREILVISTPRDLPLFRRLLGTGEKIGVRFSYAEQARPAGLAQAFTIAADFLDGSPSALVLGDNIFYGDQLPETFTQISEVTEQATIFGYQVQNPGRYGVVELDASHRPISIEEKPKHPKSSYAVPGLYFYPADVVKQAARLKPSPRGELEISDLNLLYLQESRLQVHLMSRGTAWFDTGTHSSLLEAANFVSAIQNRQGLQIACLEEIALRQGWIDRDHLARLIASMGDNTYRDYLRTL
jgi:glucose-1-phosphate thymidylyltransferase